MKMLKIEMPNGSEWVVPVKIIARNRAAHYAHEYDGDIEKSLSDDTMPLFESNDDEVEDWAANNMNWVDVKEHAKLLESSEYDLQDGWVNGDKSVIDC